MNDKSSRWQFTAYEGQYGLLATMPPGVAEWGWQDEICPTTQRPHRQGFFRLQSQQRFAWVRKTFPGIRVEVARNWDALIQYCKKEETRAPGAVPVREFSDIPSLFTYYDEIAARMARLYALIPDEEVELAMVDVMVRADIVSGRRGVQFIASNPQWITTWNKYWRESVKGAASRQTDRQTEKETLPAEYNGLAQEGQGEACGVEEGRQDRQEDGEDFVSGFT